MPRRTNPFQQLTASIMALFHVPEFEVEESVLARNKKTGSVRELDILITHKTNPELNTLVECRDHKRAQDVTWIDELDGKGRRLGFRRVVAVSSSGFTKPALAEAKERGIEAFHLKEAEEKDWGRRFFGLRTFGVNLHSDIQVKKVILESKDESIKGEGMTSKDTILVNKNLNSSTQRIKLNDFIQNWRKDPKLIEYARKNSTNDAISHFTYWAPCDEGVGFISSSGKFVQLDKVVIEFDYARGDYRVPLEHYDIGGRQVLRGQARLMGQPTSLLVEEKDGLLKVMFEQKIRKKNVDN